MSPLPNIPVMIITAGEDPVVKNSAHAHAAEHIPNCTHKKIDGAYHDVWLETDNIRHRMFKITDNFVEKSIISVHHDYNKISSLRPSA